MKITGFTWLMLPLFAFLSTYAIERKISRGTPALDKDFPFVVQLHIRANNTLPGFCGGIIISSNLILTAAHCSVAVELDPAQNTGDSLNIVAGEVRRVYQGSRSQIRSVVQTIEHDQYNDQTLENDLALLVLSSPLKFDDYVKPIQMAEPRHQFTGLAQVTGWGYQSQSKDLSTVLMKAWVPLASRQQCNMVYGNDFKASIMICAGGGVSDTCMGDSGGPLLCTLGEKTYVCGITSFGLNKTCGALSIPAVYTHVAVFSNWVKRQADAFCDPTANKCDGQNDCLSGLDEMNCNKSHAFHCDNLPFNHNHGCDSCRNGPSCSKNKFQPKGGNCGNKVQACGHQNHCKTDSSTCRSQQSTCGHLNSRCKQRNCAHSSSGAHGCKLPS